jgi:cytochrome c biogenesis protein CcmG/thiol:disulfide interchange protein DsbE
MKASPASDQGAIEDPPRPRARRSRVFLGSGIAVGLAVLGVGLGLRPPGPPVGAGRAPPISLPDLADPSATRTLAAFRGRPVVVNLFASWCLPCIRELPVLQEASVANPDVAFLGVDHQDSRRAALEMLREAGVTYPAAHDPDGKTAAAYRARGMPTTILITRTGNVAASHTGELTRPQLDTLIQEARNR